MLLDQRPQFGDNFPTRPQLDASRHGVLDQAQPHLLETIPVRRGPIADAGQHGSAEERQPLEGPLQRRAVVTRGPGRRAPGGEPGHPERIHGFRRHREDVAVARGHHGVAVAQRLTQLGDLRLERVASRRFAPQVLQEQVDPHRTTRIQGEAGQHLGRLAPRQLHPDVVAVGLDDP